MNRIKVVNRAEGAAAAEDLRDRYCFLSERHIDFLLDGLNETAIDEMLSVEE